MARIPLGNFGNAIAQPAPAVRAVPGAYDNGGAGLKQAGDALMQEGAQLLAEERQQALLLTRAKAANAVLDREISVKAIGQDISQQVEAGTLHYDEAPKVLKQRMGELGMPDMTGMDPVTAENFSKGIKRADFHGEGLITGAIQKARQADFRTQTDGLLDKLGKQASLPGADPAKLTEQIAGMDEIGQRAYGAGWAKKKQDWVDGNWDAHLNQKAMTVRDSLIGIADLEKQITEGQYADKLDSNRRNSIIAKLEGYRTAKIQRDEAAAARAERRAERVLKRAEAEFNTFQALADKGTILSPEYIDRATRMTAGTPYQQGIKMLAQQARETGGLASQPVAAQEAMLTQVDTLIAQRGRTPELDKRREQIQKVARRTGATWLLAGSIVECGNVRTPDGDVPTLALALRVIDGHSGRVRWTDQRTRSGEDRETIFGWGRVTNLERLAQATARDLVGAIRLPAEADSLAPGGNTR